MAGGRPKGATEKPWRDALNLALKRKDGDKLFLNRVAEAVVMAAAAGDMSAAKEIGDRLDGKARQEIEHSGEVAQSYVMRAPAPAETTDEWQKQHAPTIQ